MPFFFDNSNNERFSVTAEIWEQVHKRKHALDKGEAVMPVHGNELKKCTSQFEVNCMTM